MQAGEAETKHEQEIRYYASCYVSRQHGEIIFSIMQVEFIDQLCKHEPVVALDLKTSPDVIGLALKAILAESNKMSTKDNPFLSATLSDISQGKIFYSRNDYAAHQIGEYAKQDNLGKAYYDTPAYQASKAKIINDFNKYYLNFSIQATDEVIFIIATFNEWNPIQFSQQVPLRIANEELGALFLGFSRLCM
jgi:hypothetical protein